MGWDINLDESEFPSFLIVISIIDDESWIDATYASMYIYDTNSIYDIHTSTISFIHIDLCSYL